MTLYNSNIPMLIKFTTERILNASQKGLHALITEFITAKKHGIVHITYIVTL